MIKIKIVADNVTETVGMVNNEKRVFQKGDLRIIFDGWVLSDYEFRWQMKPFFYFIKTMIDKFIWKVTIENSISLQLVGDIGKIYNKMKKHLDSYQGGTGIVTKEEDIIKEVETELKKEIDEENLTN